MVTARVTRSTKPDAYAATVEAERKLFRYPRSAECRSTWDKVTRFLERKVKEAYRVKMLGGRDEQGIRWKRTKDFRVNGQMMLRTGKLLKSIRVKMLAGQVVIESDSPYAAYAFAMRPAWKEQIPQAWMDEVSRILSDGLTEMIQRRLKKR